MKVKNGNEAQTQIPESITKLNSYGNVRVLPLRTVLKQQPNICSRYPDQCPRRMEFLRKTVALEKITDAPLELHEEDLL